MFGVKSIKECFNILLLPDETYVLWEKVFLVGKWQYIGWDWEIAHREGHTNRQISL